MNLDELKRIKEETLQSMTPRNEQPETKIVIGMGTCGITAGARQTLAAAMEEIRVRNLTGITVAQAGCMGLCQREPLVDIVRPGSQIYRYGDVTPDRMKQIIHQHIVNDRPVYDWLVGTRNAAPEL